MDVALSTPVFSLFASFGIPWRNVAAEESAASSTATSARTQGTQGRVIDVPAQRVDTSLSQQLAAETRNPGGSAKTAMAVTTYTRPASASQAPTLITRSETLGQTIDLWA